MSNDRVHLKWEKFELGGAARRVEYRAGKFIISARRNGLFGGVTGPFGLSYSKNLDNGPSWAKHAIGTYETLEKAKQVAVMYAKDTKLDHKHLRSYYPPLIRP